MKIVLLDVDTVTNGDVSLAPIERLGEVVGYPLLPPEKVAAAIGDADAVVCNKTELSAEVIAACENLKFIGVFATGYNNIDLAAAKARGITVCNVPGYSTDAVAQHVFAMVLSLAGSLAAYDRSVHAGDWVREKRFTYFPYPLHELAGKTLGIFGCGAIGKKVDPHAGALPRRGLLHAGRIVCGSGCADLPLPADARNARYHQPPHPVADEADGAAHQHRARWHHGRGRGGGRAARGRDRGRGHRCAGKRADGGGQSAAHRAALYPHPAHRVGAL